MSQIWAKQTMTSILRQSIAAEKKRLAKEKEKEESNRKDNKRPEHTAYHSFARPRSAFSKADGNIKKSTAASTPRSNVSARHSDASKPTLLSLAKSQSSTNTRNSRDNATQSLDQGSGEQHLVNKAKKEDDHQYGFNTKPFEDPSNSYVGNYSSHSASKPYDHSTNFEMGHASSHAAKKTSGDTNLNDNLYFYQNMIKSKPFPGHTVEEMLAWKGDYSKLEYNHQYIQWLFPNFETRGMNRSAQALQEHEAAAIATTPELRSRVKKAYKMMLHFYGMELVSEKTGEVRKCEENWRERFKHLNNSKHNHWRITRILNALAAFGLSKYQEPLILFVISNERDLPRLQGGTLNYWWDTIQHAAGLAGNHGNDEEESTTEKSEEGSDGDQGTIPDTPVYENCRQAEDPKRGNLQQRDHTHTDEERGEQHSQIHDSQNNDQHPDEGLQEDSTQPASTSDVNVVVDKPDVSAVDKHSSRNGGIGEGEGDPSMFECTENNASKSKSEDINTDQSTYQNDNQDDMDIGTEMERCMNLESGQTQQSFCKGNPHTKETGCGAALKLIDEDYL